jgi:hypothetical protein
MLSLKTLFSEMGIFPTDDILDELLKSCGKDHEEDQISFELFARTVALLLEENLDKGSTSSARAPSEQPMDDDYYEEDDQN